MGEVVRGPGNQFNCAVNLEQDLYANSDGRVYPIVDWRDAQGDKCEKGDAAAYAIAGEDEPRPRWFCVHLGEFGLGPLVAMYPLSDEVRGRLNAGHDRLRSAASVDRSAEGGEPGSEADGLDPKDESAVDGAAGETPNLPILNRSNPNEPG